VAFRAYLPAPRLAERMVDLRAELRGRIGPGMLPRHRAYVDKQPGVSPPELELRGI
jgi:hypothetical protein